MAMKLTDEEIAEHFRKEFARREQDGKDPFIVLDEYTKDAYFAGKLEGAKWARDKACEWVPVEKEYPKDGESVLILTKEGAQSVARFSNKLPWWSNKVTHWQPLPEKTKSE